MESRLRFRDLKARNIVRNRVTLGNWIRHQGFPTGQLTGPNSRTWTEGEIGAWLASRPTSPKLTPKPKNHPGRPRKQREQITERSP